MDEDLHYIGQMAGVEFEMVHKNQNGVGKKYELAKQYFGQLDKKVVLQLFELYRVDFELFGYTADSFIKK